MNRRHDYRYDPLYRVIREPEQLHLIEGRFRCLFDRLKRIGNLGIIPEVFEMAKYPKYEHGLGTVHQVKSLLDVADAETIPEKYGLPLTLAGIFIHVGHLPYTYSTERALLLASNLGDRSEENDIRKYVSRALDKVLEAGRFGADRKKSVLEDMFCLRHYKDLYRYFSAEVVVEKWNTLSKDIKGLDEDILRITVRNLVDKESEGRKYLDLADRADFVQRDALYLGTVRLDIAPEHLYGQLSNRRPNLSVDERKLIQYNLDYLTEKFYDNPEVICFSRLYEKILASLIWCKNFRLRWLREYDDSQLKRLICNNLDKDNRGARLAENWIKRAGELFDNELDFEVIAQLTEVHFEEEKDVIDIEYDLTGKQESVRGLLTYPFTAGVLLSVEYQDKGPYPAPPYRESVSVSIFRDRQSKKLIEVLRVVQRLSRRLSVFNHAGEIREALGRMLSWTDAVRFDNGATVREIAEAIASLESGEKYAQGEFMGKYLDALSSIRTFDSLWDDFENQLFLWRSRVGRRSARAIHDERVFFASGLLGLPSRLLQFVSTRQYLEEIYGELLRQLTSDDVSSSRKGDIFEAMYLVDRVRTRRGRFQLFLSGMVVRDPAKSVGQRDDNEFDVIELFIDEDDEAECWISACCIADDYRAQNQDQLTRLVDHIHGKFPALKTRSWYVIPEDRRSNRWKPRKEDSGRKYN